MSYTTSIDNKTFSSKEEAIKYFEENYLFEQKDMLIDKIVNEIKKVVSSDLKIETEANDKDELTIIVKNEDFIIDAVLNTKEDVYCYGGVYNTLESVVEFFRWSTDTVSQIISIIKNTYDFKEFIFDRYHNDYGNGHYFDFSYVTNENVRHQATYEPGDIHKFIDGFKQHFVSVLEGDSEVIEEMDYFIDYEIDGTPIGGLLERAKKSNKKVRLEILE